MTDWTPTTEQVRGYVTRTILGDATDDILFRGMAFDRWLAQHDAEVKAAAWDEGHHAGVYNATSTDDEGFIDNPYPED